MEKLKTPLEHALNILLKFYSSIDKDTAKERLEWYFGEDFKTLNIASLVLLGLTGDWDDTVAWELHELVEACEVYRLNRIRNLNLKSPVLSIPFQAQFIKVKPIAHAKASAVEIKFLKSIGRQDLVNQVVQREKAMEEMKKGRLLTHEEVFDSYICGSGEVK